MPLRGSRFTVQVRSLACLLACQSVGPRVRRHSEFPMYCSPRSAEVGGGACGGVWRTLVATRQAEQYLGPTVGGQY
ncbi:hypothetical protein C8R45DRAFT_1042921 [Mycena sanguinolenta]|nr:hypothetical protein C8R45DRAFT_1042921 [Mycena sanguinolenta]